MLWVCVYRKKCVFIQYLFVLAMPLSMTRYHFTSQYTTTSLSSLKDETHPSEKDDAHPHPLDSLNCSFSFIRCRMNPSYNEAAMDDRNWHNSKATPEMILKELGIPHKTPIHYDRKKINLQWSEHSS